MATTTNLSITLSSVGGDNNAWGTVNNNAINAFDAIFASNGTSVSMQVGSGKTLTIGGTLAAGSATAAALPSGTTINGVAAVNLSATQTLSNKTIASPVFSGTPSGTIVGGTASITINAVSNVSGTPTADDAQYIRVGNVVHVSGRFSAQASIATTFTVRLSLPVSSDLTAASQLAGTVSYEAGAGSGPCLGDTTNDNARMIPTAPDTSPHYYYYSYTYVVA